MLVDAGGRGQLVAGWWHTGLHAECGRDIESQPVSLRAVVPLISRLPAAFQNSVCNLLRARRVFGQPEGVEGLVDDDGLSMPGAHVLELPWAHKDHATSRRGHSEDTLVFTSPMVAAVREQDCLKVGAV